MILLLTILFIAALAAVGFYSALREGKEDEGWRKTRGLRQRRSIKRLLRRLRTLELENTDLKLEIRALGQQLDDRVEGLSSRMVAVRRRLEEVDNRVLETLKDLYYQNSRLEMRVKHLTGAEPCPGSGEPREGTSSSSPAGSGDGGSTSKR